MNNFYLAQCNIALARAPLDHPIMADFVANLNQINSVAEASPGFIWRLKTEAGDATAIRVFNHEQIIVNMSVWESIDSLFAYTYRTQHTNFFRRREEWFEPMADYPHLALWWIPLSQLPDTEEIKARLDYLQQHGPTEYAFTFKTRFPKPDESA